MPIISDLFPSDRQLYIDHKKRAREKTERESFIGISDQVMKLSRVSMETMVVESEYSFHIHITYSVWDDYLIARCLDFNIFQRVDLKEEVVGILQKSDDLAKFLIKKVTKKVYNSITDYLFYLDETKFSDIANHAPDEYWNEYRLLRNERDNSMLQKILEISDEKRVVFEELPDTLADFIDAIRSRNLKVFASQHGDKEPGMTYKSAPLIAKIDSLRKAS